MVTIYIDNKPYSVKPGRNLLETCLTLGFDLPYFCWHPALGSAGACRQCAIKAFRDENDRTGRLIMSCMEPVASNQRISVSDPAAVSFRSGVIEWLMTNHPHDCAVCDEGGSCHLQDMTVMTGHNYRRYAFRKRTHVNQDLGPFLNHEMNRCIQCYRCVRFYRDHAGGDDLDVFASKSSVYFGRHEPGKLESEFSGNLSEVCPTGVFTDKTFKQHYTRKWDLTMAPSVCQHCSLGCNIIAGERYGSLRMVANRYHGQVNGYFICDRGRFGYEFVNARDRITRYTYDGNPADAGELIRQLAVRLTNSKVIGIGSPRASLQSNFALRKLVGDENFSCGVSLREQQLAQLAVRLLREGPVPACSLREAETSDAVFILGEDLTNTAPMLALAVRQSVRQKPLQDAAKISVPAWNDAAARVFVQDKRGPLFVATTHATRLDGIATGVHRAAPQDIARLGFAVAHALDSSAPEVGDLDKDELARVTQIAEALMSADNPLIISGTSSHSEHVVKAAAQVALALHKKGRKVKMALTMAECNTYGMALLGGLPLEEAFQKVLNGQADTVVVLENDLYRRAQAHRVDSFLGKCKALIVIDHTPHATASKAQWLIPAGTFAESDGIIVNNEGRAQRYYQVYESPAVTESWRLISSLGMAANNTVLSGWKTFDDVTNAMVSEVGSLAGLEKVSPSSQQRMADGQRVPRQPHRYSGRTAMQAHKNVSEPRPPEDQDSGMSYTMEGTRAMPPSSMIPFFWSPGWNSVQSVNKYQEEVGAALHGGDPGVLMNGTVKAGGGQYSSGIPEKFKPSAGKLWAVPVHHIFGSDELSARSAPVATQIPEPYLLVNRSDAAAMNLAGGESAEVEIGGVQFRLPVMPSDSLPSGVAGLPCGLPHVAYADVPAWCNFKR
jgi:NADH-quinone oxidoreductase subunit G